MKTKKKKKKKKTMLKLNQNKLNRKTLSWSIYYRFPTSTTCSLFSSQYSHFLRQELKCSTLFLYSKSTGNIPQGQYRKILPIYFLYLKTI